MRSACAHSVKVFYGKEPKFGSGRSGTISGNSTQGVSMNEGDMLWITDDHENGISNFVASAGSHELEISSSCTSFVVR